MQRRIAARIREAAALALRRAAWVCVAGCALPDGPPPPPAPAPATPRTPKPPTRSPLPAWKPRRDARAAAELAALDARARRLIETYNELDEGDTRGPQLLLDAAAIFEEAGRLGHAIRLLTHLRRIDPERAETAHAEERVRAHLRSLLDDRAAASTLQARACGATIIDPPPSAAAPALLAVARCLDEDRLLFAVSLRYRRLAAERGADRRNAAQIEVLEELRATVERDLSRLAAPAGGAALEPTPE